MFFAVLNKVPSSIYPYEAWGYTWLKNGAFSNLGQPHRHDLLRVWPEVDFTLKLHTKGINPGIIASHPPRTR
jgi:hypothetical protein